MLKGGCASHESLNAWVEQNKRGLRAKLGGQGVQRIMRLRSLIRRAAEEKVPSTVFSAILKGAAPWLVAKLGGMPALAARAIEDPWRACQERQQRVLCGAPTP